MKFIRLYHGGPWRFSLKQSLLSLLDFHLCAKLGPDEVFFEVVLFGFGGGFHIQRFGGLSLTITATGFAYFYDVTVRKFGSALEDSDGMACSTCRTGPSCDGSCESYV